MDRDQEFRYLLYKNYKIIYWLNIKENRIEINDVFDTLQNPIKIQREKLIRLATRPKSKWAESAIFENTTPKKTP